VFPSVSLQVGTGSGPSFLAGHSHGTELVEASGVPYEFTLKQKPGDGPCHLAR